MKPTKAQGRAPQKPTPAQVSLSIQYVNVKMQGDEREIRSMLKTIGSAIATGALAGAAAIAQQSGAPASAEFKL